MTFIVKINSNVRHGAREYQLLGAALFQVDQRSEKWIREMWRN